MALSLCIKKRAPVRSQVTKIYKEIISNLGSESKDYFKATVGVRRIKDVQKVLLSSDKEIIDILAEDDEADLEKEMDDCADYQEIIFEAIVAYEDAQKQVAREVVVQDSFPDTTKKIRLPTIELPKFSGNLIDWLTFWAQFEKIHLDIRVKDSVKFYYLLQSLSVDTEAYKIVSIYPLTEENYSKAIDALRRRYANPILSWFFKKFEFGKCKPGHMARNVALQTLMLNVIAPKGRKLVRAFFDSGSQHTYILKTTAEELGLKPVTKEIVHHALFGGIQTTAVTHNLYDVQLKADDENFVCKVTVRDQSKICQTLPRIPKTSLISKELEQRKIKVTDLGNDNPPIELLIGADIYGKLITGKTLQLDCGLTAMLTHFGWTLLGSLKEWSDEENSMLVMSMNTMFGDSRQDFSISQLWDLDTIGVRDPVEVKSSVEQETAFKNEFLKNISRNKDGRYVVPLPWIEGHPPLPTNEIAAHKRLTIEVREEDRDAMRFLWWQNQYENQVQVYLHTRVMFGATCSPFILGTVLEYHLTHMNIEDSKIAEKLLNSFYIESDCVKPIQWRFNPPFAAWWGGWWERLIRSMKNFLKRTLGKATLRKEQLVKMLEGVQSIMNGRPLTYISEEMEDPQPLTPAMFLRHKGNIKFPEGDLTEKDRLQFSYAWRKSLERELKNRFRSEYLSHLINKNKGKNSHNLRIGDIVVIGSDLRKRTEWPLGRIKELLKVKIRSQIRRMDRYLASIDEDISGSDLHKLKLIDEGISEIKTETKILFDELFEQEEVDEEKELESYETIQDKMEKLEIKLRRALEGIQSTADTKQAKGLETVKLPKFELPHFYGDANSWFNFKEVFGMAIDQNPGLNDLQKLQYLGSAVKGEAARLIRGFPISSESYKQAWDTLVSRCDNQRELAYAQLNKIFKIKQMKNPSAKSLRELLDTCNESVRNLGYLGLQRNELADIILVQFLRNRIDEDMKRQWELTQDERSFPSYENFILFLERQARSLPQGSREYQRKENEIQKDYANEHFAINTNAQICIACKAGHRIYNCTTFRTMPIEQKWEFVKQNKMCYNCLKKGHARKNCYQGPCKKCDKMHHTLLHKLDTEVTNTQKGAKPQIFKPVSEINNTSIEQGSETINQVLLAIAQIILEGEGGTQQICRALLDSGSQVSLITKEICEKLGLKGETSRRSLRGIGNNPVQGSSTSVKLTFKSIYRSEKYQTNAIVMEVLTTEIPNFKLAEPTWIMQRGLELADLLFHISAPIDIILDADMYANLMHGEKKCFYYQKDDLVWVLLPSEKYPQKYSHPKHTPFYYQKDDLVWGFTPIRKVGLSEKLLKRYFGPYKVTKKLSEVTYEVEPVDPSPRSRKSKDIVHVIRMKPYLDPEEQHSILLGNTEDNFSNIMTDYEALAEKDDVSTISGTAAMNYQLPKLEFKKFGGEPREWITFWSQFSTIDRDPQMPPETKFQYLFQATAENSEVREAVESFPPSADNYPKVIEYIKSRFGEDEMLVEIYVRDLLQNVRAEGKMSVVKLYDRLETQLRALKTLGVARDKFAAMLYPLVESALPEDTLRVWERSQYTVSGRGVQDKLTQLMTFLKKEVKGESRVNMAKAAFKIDNNQDAKDDRSNRKSLSKKNTGSNMPTATDLANTTQIANTTQMRNNCIFYGNGHPSQECYSGQRMHLPEKKDKAKGKNVCFWCLLPGHGFKKCRIKPCCPVCGGKHYPIMCPTLEAQKTSHLQKAELKVSGESPATKQETANQFTSTTLNNVTVGGVYLQTLIVKISGPKGKHNVRVLLDCGSQRSYILKRMVDALGLKRVQQVTLTHNLFGGGEIRQKKHNVYKVNVSSLNNEYIDDLKFLDQASKPKVVHYNRLAPFR
ncbi:hypothetical protein LAZ67_9001435, partial [Cordylochernes scorpioides]